MSAEIAGRISHITYYPIKSCSAVEVQKAQLTPDGLVGDREFMIVRAGANERGVHDFITQRDKKHPEDRSDKPQSLSVLARVKPERADDGYRLTWAGEDPFYLPNDRNAGPELLVKVWDDVTSAVDQGNDIAEWLSGHLNIPVRLVKAAGLFERQARQNYLENNNGIRFPDAYPIHWFPEASVAELSERAGQTILWQRFRPNLVVEGMPAQAEHLIHAGEVAGIPFLEPKPCDRCPVTGVNQKTGDLEQLKALTVLASYKKWRKHNRPDGELTTIFGENMLPLGSGEICVGDELIATELRNPPLIYGASV